MSNEMHSSVRLAAALDEAGFPQLAKRARKHEFHDFLSPHPLPSHELVAELRELPKSERMAQRVMDGEFDATKPEADEWANGPEGMAAVDALAASSRIPETGLVDENHTLLVGNVMGALMRLAADAETPTHVEPVMRRTEYTNRIRVKRNSGNYIVTVEPEKP